MNAKQHFLSVGTLITSIRGESNSMDHGEIFTGPIVEGFIETVIPKQETCYSVVFPKSGAAIWLTEAEVRDATSYTIGAQLQDGELLAFDLDDDGNPTKLLVQWDGRRGKTYVSGHSLEDYGMHNLRPHEAIRLGVTPEDLQAAVHQHQLQQFDAQVSAAPLQLEREDVATILAALRYYQRNGQGNPDNRDDAIHDIATAGGAVISRDDEGIDDLYHRLNGIDAIVGLVKPRCQAAL